MDEIYLSWKTCVADAYDWYQEVLEAKLSGTLPRKKKLPADYLVSMTARSMSEQDKVRRLRKELFHDFKETAIGMMENIQEAEEHMEQVWDKMMEEFRKD